MFCLGREEKVKTKEPSPCLFKHMKAKKLLALLLTVVMLVGLLPMTVVADGA